jgi:hypothetical protein
METEDDKDFTPEEIKQTIMSIDHKKSTRIRRHHKQNPNVDL